MDGNWSVDSCEADGLDIVCAAGAWRSIVIVGCLAFMCQIAVGSPGYAYFGFAIDAYSMILFFNEVIPNISSLFLLLSLLYMDVPKFSRLSNKKHTEKR